MTNPHHEPSYYEIALTNRQVVVAFVVLLICLVSAFFSGLWIGRESAARAQQALASNTLPADAAPTPAPEGEALEEFEFFESEQAQGQAVEPPADPTPAAAAPESSEDTTLLDDFGGEGDGAIDPDPALPEGRRRQGRIREIEADAPPVEETDEPAPTPAPTPAPRRPRAERPSGAAEPRLAAGQVVIQVFSSPELDQAERVRDRLVGGGHKAFLSPVEVAGRTMYRVRIGPFDSRGRAQTVAEQVRKGYKLDTWVTE